MATKRVNYKKETKQRKQTQKTRKNKRRTIRGSGAAASAVARTAATNYNPLSTFNTRINFTSDILYDFVENTLRPLPGGFEDGDIVIGFNSNCIGINEYLEDSAIIAGVLKIAKYNYNTGEAIRPWEKRNDNSIIYPVEPIKTYTGPVVQIEELFINTYNKYLNEKTVNYYIRFTPIIEFLDKEICKFSKSARENYVNTYFKDYADEIYRPGLLNIFINKNFYKQVYKNYSKVFNSKHPCHSNSDDFSGVIFEEGT